MGKENCGESLLGVQFVFKAKLWSYVPQYEISAEVTSAWASLGCEMADHVLDCIRTDLSNGTFTFLFIISL